MFKMSRIFMLAALLAVGACSSGGDDDSFVAAPEPVVEPPTDPTVPVIPDAASIEAITSNPQLQSDGGIPVIISALVKDANNNFIEGAVVQFSSDSGGIEQINTTTGTDGVATARLSTQSDPTNRVIVVTTTTGDLSDTVNVNVIGTNLQITGPTNLAQGAVDTFTLVLNNANGQGIDGRSIDVTSSLGNTLSSQTLTTDSSGQAQFEYTAVNGGTDTITATALGESAAAVVQVADDSFAFVSPSANTEIDLGATQSITLRWSQNNSPVIGQSVSFAATRGSVTPSSVVTNASGEASVSISATNAGQSTISATTANGPSATLSVEFVATMPDSIEVQASPFTIAPNSQSAITAVVRDANGNLVKNVVVEFDVDDITGGGLSVASAITDSQGRAQTFYTSSSQTSSVDGIAVTAAVSNSAIDNTVLLTVAGREVFFTFGTGNEIFEPNSSQYRVPYVIQVTDTDGRPVAGVNVIMRAVSVKYIKGYWCGNEGANAWISIVNDRCDDEDFNRNGILDLGEDINFNNTIEAGNIATVAPANGATDIITDSSGFAFIDIFYPQEYGGWLEVELEARASVQGTESSETAIYLLNVAASDTEDLDTSPPGRIVVPQNFTRDPLCTSPTGIFSSPFGYNPDCATDDFDN
ncbi:MAG: Ig-like domain-containing protein [Gammaproteobacteria bacterium]